MIAMPSDIRGYVKTPSLFWLQLEDAAILPARFLQTAHTLEALSNSSHPNLFKYIGYIKSSSRLVGIYLERSGETLCEITWVRKERVNKSSFLRACAGVKYFQSSGSVITTPAFQTSCAGRMALLSFLTATPVKARETR